LTSRGELIVVDNTMAGLEMNILAVYPVGLFCSEEGREHLRRVRP